MEEIKNLYAGHNLFDIFYGRYKKEEKDLLKNILRSHQEMNLVIFLMRRIRLSIFRVRQNKKIFRMKQNKESAR